MDFDYTPDPSDFSAGSVLCLVAAPVSLDMQHKMHRLATIPHGKHFRFEGQLEFGKASHSLLRVRVQQAGALPLLACDDETIVLSHDHCSWQKGREVIELCAGLGALGQGALAAQFRPCIAVEWRPKLAALYQKNSEAEVIVGDITEFATVRLIHEKHSTSATITSGISCQPYSKLGDGRSGLDPRSQTLPATLAIAHYLRAVAVVLECVEPASTDAYVQWHVTEFCKRTGFCRSEKVLHLHDVWPCRRSRWWCVLTAPAIGDIGLQQLPKLFDLPTVRHILPGQIQWELEEEKQLQLSAIEMEAFSTATGTPDSYMLNMSGQMPCALHAWGSQLGACPCGCRETALSSQRLANRGLYGVLTIGQSHDMTTTKKYRHMHPQEVAMLCGLDPLLRWGKDVRLALSGVGQLASPLQAIWVLMHLGAKLHETQFGTRKADCIQTLCLYRAWLLARVSTLFPEQIGKLGSEAQHLAQKWFPIRDLPMDQLVTEDRSLCECALNVDNIVTSQEHSANALCLTATQVVIPSPTTEVPTPDEGVGVSSPVATGTEEDQSTQNEEVKTGEESSAEIGESATFVKVCIHYASCPEEACVTAQVPWGAAIRYLMEAEAALQGFPAQSVRVKSSSGITIELDDQITQDMSIVVVHPESSAFTMISDADQPEPTPIDDAPPVNVLNPLCQVVGQAFVRISPPKVGTMQQVQALRAQNLTSEDRCVMLANQSLIWGDDEVIWHLVRIAQAVSEEDDPVFVLDPILAYGWSMNCVHGDAKKWLDEVGEANLIITTLWHQGHWIPVVFRFVKQVLSITFLKQFDSDEVAVTSLSRCMQDASTATSFILHPTVQKQSSSSCGAESIRFFEETVLSWPSPIDEAYDPHEQYRSEFQAHISKQFLTTHPWMWGAGKDEEEQAIEALVPFLRDHGVASDAVQQRAQQAVAKLGANEILRACSNKAPWRTLKALGSNSKFQFVLPAELQVQIEAKAGRGEIGKVGQKKKPAKNGKVDEVIELDPQKLSIPDRTFQSDGNFVNQITMAQIGPLASGVAIATMLEAEPFLSSGKYVSQEPLALMVLNAPNVKQCTTLPNSLVTIPARCVINNEPILLEATLVQLGSGKVEKVVHKPAMDLDTVEVDTIKMVVYKDEINIGWESFVQGPVKYILTNYPMLRLCTEPHCKCEAWHNEEQLPIHSGVVDVWRRQFLRHGFKPESPQAAIMFSVCFRIPKCLKLKVLEQSGAQGIYTEPRSLDAREPDRMYDVIWIPKADKSTVMHLKQTNPAAIGIVRNADRWGLRAVVEQAPALHQVIRPDAVYLAQGPRLQFSVSPVPYGTDRRALSKAFKALGWEAKPIQPTGAVDGGRGNIWAVHATESPPSNIMTLGHGEIVISKVRMPNDGKADVMKPIAATATLNLCGTPSKAGPIKDPWVVRDPWQHFQPTTMSTSNAATDASASIKQLENKIEQAVLAKLPTQTVTNMEQDDVPDRIDTLERQVQTLMQKQQRLETTVGENHIQQSAQMTQLQGQLQAQGQQFAGQLEGHQQSLHQMFDAQMQQIRSLLSKRQREDGE